MSADYTACAVARSREHNGGSVNVMKKVSREVSKDGREHRKENAYEMERGRGRTCTMVRCVP